MDSRKKFIIIDGNAILHRAFHALPPLTTKAGEVVNAAYGFMLIFLKVLKDLAPDYLAVAFDRKAPTFRHEMFAQYKAKRKKQPDELYAQIPMIKDLLAAFRVSVFEKDGYEADDIIGTLVFSTKDTRDIIVTGDADAFQLADENTSVYVPRKGISNAVEYGPEGVMEKYGFGPEKLADYKALAGDPSDNIPGVSGVGRKTATDLVVEFGSLDGIYDHLDECGAGGECRIKERFRKLLLQYKEEAFLSRKLATIVKDVPIEFDLEDCRVVEYDREKAVALFQQFEFKSLMDKLPSLLTGSEGSEPEGGGRETVEEVEDWNGFIKELEKREYFAIAASKKGKKTKLAFCWQEGKSYSVILDKEKAALLKPILENEDIGKCGHDLKDDVKLLAKEGIAVKGLYFDTMIASYLLNPGSRSHGLQDIVFKELGKDIRNIDDKAAAAEYIFLAAGGMERAVEKEALGALLAEIEMPLVPVLAAMEMNGIELDTKMLAKISKEIGKEIGVLQKKIFALAGGEFNVNSPKQLKEALFDKLGISTAGIKRTKTGISTAASELEKLLPRHEIIGHIFRHRELAKIKSTYADALPKLVSKETGRLHASFNQAVTSTGRLSSSNPNLQNIPIRTELGRKIRGAFKAEDGFVLVSADYSQIELRIVASLAGDRLMMESFDKGEDIHARTAAEIAGCKLEEVTKDMRRNAKAVNFGVIYGMGAYGLAKSAGISAEEARLFIEKYFQAYSGIKAYVEETIAMAHSLGYAETLFGRKRFLPEINSGVMGVRAAAERMAINMPVQGTAADLMKLAMIEVDRVLDEKYGARRRENVRMLMQVHDELVFEVKKSRLPECAKLVKEAMENPSPKFKLKVPVEVKVKSGDNWNDMG